MWLGLQRVWGCLEWNNQGNCNKYGWKHLWDDGTEYKDISNVALNTTGGNLHFMFVESSEGKQIRGVWGHARRKYACITTCEG